MANLNRRDVLRYGAVGAVSVAAAGVALQSLAPTSSHAGGHHHTAAAAVDLLDFDEKYKGKKIKGKHNAHGAGKHELRINNKKLALTAISTLFVPEDGSEPHVGIGLISAVNHYDPVEFDGGKHKNGLKNLAKKVVDILGELDLTDEAAKGHHH